MDTVNKILELQEAMVLEQTHGKGQFHKLFDQLDAAWAKLEAETGRMLMVRNDTAYINKPRQLIGKSSAVQMVFAVEAMLHTDPVTFELQAELNKVADA